MNKIAILVLGALVVINSRSLNAIEPVELGQGAVSIIKDPYWEAYSRSSLICTRFFSIGGDYFHCSNNGVQVEGGIGNESESSKLFYELMRQFVKQESQKK